MDRAHLWRYTTTFRAAAAAPGERIDLDFEGLDTVATVSLNGTVLGPTANMHRSHRFDVRDLLVDGDNELTVDFAAQTDATLQASEDLGPVRTSTATPSTDPQDGLQLRLGLGSRAGDRRDLAAGDAAPLDHGTPRGRPPARGRGGSTGTVEVHVDVERAAGASRCGSRRRRGQDAEVEVGPDGTAVLRLEVADRRCGGRAATASSRSTRSCAAAGDDAELESWERRVGFRTVTLDTTPDATGTPFTFVVNGTPILVRGANWIPDDCFPSRSTAPATSGASATPPRAA